MRHRAIYIMLLNATLFTIYYYYYYYYYYLVVGQFRVISLKLAEHPLALRLNARRNYNQATTHHPLSSTCHGQSVYQYWRNYSFARSEVRIEGPEILKSHVPLTTLPFGGNWSPVGYYLVLSINVPNLKFLVSLVLKLRRSHEICKGLRDPDHVPFRGTSLSFGHSLGYL